MDLRDQLQATLGSAFTVNRELGGGGMSRVYVATDQSLGREIVVKVLTPELSEGVSVERFRREIQVAARLQHPNIVTLLSAGETDGLPFYTMPFVAGESLRGRLVRTGELPVREATSILRDLARALSYAHAHGVVHRDIKPDNILLADDYALVTDFGVAKALSEARATTDPAHPTLTGLGMALGTPGYMAPEQAAGDTNVDHRADIYAFGVVAYEMLTGGPLFDRHSVQAVMVAHISEPPTPITTRRPQLPASLADLITRCLEKRPADRPQSADELIRAIDAVVTPAEQATRAVAPGPARWGSRRRPLIIGTVTVAAIAAAIVAAVVGSKGKPLDDNVIMTPPFRVSARDSSAKFLRNGIPDLIYTKLTGTIHAADQRTVANEWRKAGGTDATDVSRDDLLRIARRLGAGRLLDGTVVQRADGSIELTGTLLAVRGNDEWTARASGALADVAALVDTVVSSLLLKGAGEHEQRVAKLAAIPFDALQAFLEGESAFRVADWERAAAAYARAIAIDSTFALAALRASIADGWLLTGTAPAMADLARRHRANLGARDLLYVGLRPDGTPPASAAERLAMFEEAVTTSPDVPDLWYRLGDELLHYGRQMGIDAPMQRANAAFERSLAIDSNFALGREHLPITLAGVGDTAEALRQLDRPGMTSGSMLLNRALLGQTEPAGILPIWVKQNRSLRVMFSEIVTLTAPLLADSMIVLLRRDAATNADRQRLAEAETKIALNQGQPRRAVRIGDATPLQPHERVLDYLFWDGDSSAARTALPTVMASLVRAPDNASADQWTTSVLAAGLYELSLGRTELPSRAIAVLRQWATNPNGAHRGRARNYALLLDASLASITSRSDASALLAAVDSVIRQAEDDPGHFELTGGLVAARLWEKSGSLDRAYRSVTRQRAIPGLWSHYYSTYMREQARLAEAMGNSQVAVDAYRKYLRLRPKPESSLIPDRDNAVRAIDRLTKQAGK